MGMLTYYKMCDRCENQAVLYDEDSDGYYCWRCYRAEIDKQAEEAGLKRMERT